MDAPNWGPVLLSDTVGFIRDLPHSLIASFKATLEETRQADLLLHVADASSPNVSDQITAVYDVLQEIGIEEKDTLLVLNKVDQIKNLANLESVLNRYRCRSKISNIVSEADHRLLPGKPRSRSPHPSATGIQRMRRWIDANLTSKNTPH